jgi:hypothetical protein
VRHGQRPENFMLAQMVEGFLRDTLKRDSEEDETDIAVLSSVARIGGERSGEGGGKKCVSRLGSQEELFVRGQARRVSQQHPQCNAVASGIFPGELCQYRHDGQVEVEEAAFVENHSHAGGGDYFGYGSKIKNSLCGHFRRIGFVGETTEGLQSHEAATVRDGDGSCGEGAICDGLLYQFKSGREYRVLLLMSRSG